MFGTSDLAISLSLSRLDVISENLGISKHKSKCFAYCHVCHLAKKRKLSFPSPNNICNEDFELLHIWGPFSVETLEGYRYFLTIVDDHSRATWIYLLKTKNEVRTVFTNFIKMVENQYKTKVKSVRSDNAPDLRFTNLYQEKGILAYHSCQETPKQNSVVERKPQHILNVACALMFQSQVPLHLGGDCVLTIVFLINRTPSQLLSNKTPYEKITNKAPDYSQIRTFGCLCYGLTSPKQRYKFANRSKACIFLGYPTGYKGYRLLDLETNNISISRNVEFHEDVFPLVRDKNSEVLPDIFNSLDCLPSAPPISSSHPINSHSNHSISIPLSSVSTHRQIKPPAHLQDYHCYSLQSTAQYPISLFLSYSKISPSHLSYINSITKIPIPQSYYEAKESIEFCHAMDNEFGAMELNDTWE